MGLPQIFDGLNDIDAATAKRRFAVRHVAPGEVLFVEGEVGRALGCLVQGVLEIRSAGSVVGRVLPGATLGELGLFEDSVRTATVIAPEGAEVWLLERDEYEALRDTMHPICVHIERRTIDAQVAWIEQIGDRVSLLGLGEVVPPPPARWLTTLRRWFGAGDLRPASAEPIAALARSALFADAPPAVLHRLAPAFSAFRCDPGAVLCVEGEIGDRMFLLGEGEVQVLVSSDGAPHCVATLSVGDAFGMVSLARAGRRMSSCVAAGEATVFALERRGWHALVDEPHLTGSTFRRAVIRAFSEQLRSSNAMIASWDRAVRDADVAEAVGRHLAR